MKTTSFATEPGGRHAVLGYVLAIGLVVVATLFASLLQHLFGKLSPALIFLTAVLFSAAGAGLRPSVICASLSLLSYDFFFVEPLHTLSVSEPDDILSLAVFLIVAILTSQLTARISAQRLAAEEREAHTAAIYAFSREIAEAIGLDKVLAVITRRVAELFETRAAVLLPDSGTLKVAASYPSGTVLRAEDIAAAAWAWTHGSPTASVSSDVNADERWLTFSLATGRGETAVLALDRGVSDAPMSIEQTRLLGAIVRQAAVAIESCNVDPVLDENALVEQIIEASENGIVVLDADARIVDVNAVACLIFGLERTLVIAHSLDEICARSPRYGPLRDAVARFLRAPAGAGEKVELNVFLRGRDHSYLLQLAPFRTRADASPGAILSFQDVTYVRDQEARREALVATLSHELRTPLTSLKMAVERLRRLPSNGASAQGEILETAHEDVLRLQEVAQHFLDLARSRAVVARMDPRPLDVNSLVQRSVRLVSLQARDKGLTIEAPLCEVPMISGDEIKLTWALSNLLTNAIRHTPSGGKVTVSAASAPSGVAISVADTGPGIPAEERERIFEPFSQSTASGEVGAAGLGLAIVRDIVQMHDGRIRLTSEPGRGTCFVLELPGG